MTLIAGYINQGTVFIIADSAVTIMLDNNMHNDNYTEKKYSSFGESIELENNRIIIDYSQKILSLKNRIICSFAGSQSEGFGILEDLNISISCRPEIQISKLLKDFFDLNRPQHSQYILGFHEDGVPKIFVFDDLSTIMTLEDSFILLGNGRDNMLINNPLEYLIKLIGSWKGHPDIRLAKFVSLSQCYAINANTYSSGVGGHFNGAYVDSSGIKWMEDSCNMLYSSQSLERGETFAVFKYNRDGVTYVSSPKNGRNVFFPNLQFLDINLEQWKDKWMDKLLESESSFTARFFIFICYDRRIVVIIDKQNGKMNEYLSFSKESPNILNTEISKKLIDKLHLVMVDSITGSENPNNLGALITYL